MTKRGFACVLVAVVSVLVLGAGVASILLGGETAKADKPVDTISKSLTACCNRYVRGMNLENDPIDYSTGELVLKAVDFHETSPRLDFALVRTYRSRTMPGGSFGPGWAFTFDVSVSPAEGGYVMVNDGIICL